MKERNVLNLTRAIAIAALMAPASAYPMGVGDLQLHSALNQKLQAEIRLHLAPGEDPSDISVRLASPEKFDQAGVPWSYFLSKIQFNPVVLNNGTVLVKVSSKEVLTEPFLNFLLEVSWPQGSVYREFTVLIDPPSEYDTPVAVASRAAQSAPAITESAYEPPMPRQQRKVRTTPRAVPAPANAEARKPAPSQPIVTDGTYGPTRQADTLWNIASRLADERNVATNEMMNALFEANPEAFTRGNINALKVGATLKVPDASAMKMRPVRKNVAKQQLPVTKGQGLTLEAPGEIKAGGSANGKPGEAGIGGTGSGDAKALEMQSRLEKLEQQLSIMQKTLELRDQQLAALQNQSNAKAQPPAQTATTPVTSQPDKSQQAAQPTDTQPQPQQQQPTGTTPAPVNSVPTDQQVAPKPQPPAPKPVIKPAPVKAPEPEFDLDLALGIIGAGLAGVFGWLLWRKRKIERQTDSESMFAMASQVRVQNANLAGNAMVVPVVNVDTTGIFEAGNVGESSFISDFAPSDFDSFDTDQNEIDPLSEADVYLAYGRYQQAEDLIRRAIVDQPARDDYRFKLLEILHASDNLDGFGAYIQDLANEGKQSDISFWNKIQDVAKELVPSLDLTAIKPMTVAQIQPTMIAAAASTARADSYSGSSGVTSLFGDLDFGIESDIDIPAAVSPAPKEDDFLDSSSLIVPMEAGSLRDLQSDLGDLQLNIPNDLMIGENALDFDLSSFVGEVGGASEPAADKNIAKSGERNEPAGLSGLDTFSSLKLDEEFFAPRGGGKASSSNSGLSEDSFTLNFDSEIVGFAPNPLDFPATRIADKPKSTGKGLPDFDAMSSAISQTSAPVSKKDSNKIGDEFDFSFDFDTAVSELTTGTSNDLSSVGDLTDMDEFETKIDLAKAYVDMGDTETAKSIAEEVLQQGSSEQKRLAQALLDQLK